MDQARDDIWAMEHRHSVRRFTGETVPADVRAELERAVAAANATSGLHMQLAWDEPEAFKTMLAHYGKFQNACNYLALVGPKGPDLDELCGYFGEKIVLLTQRLGLNSCWVGGTFSRKRTRCDVGAGERLVMVVALGLGVDDGRPRRSKGISELSNTHGLVMPDWFQHGMQAAALAPTALNQQHFIFTLDRDRTRVRAQSTGGFFSKVDLGIAECHFELANGHAVDGSAASRLAGSRAGEKGGR